MLFPQINIRYGDTLFSWIAIHKTVEFTYLKILRVQYVIFIFVYLAFKPSTSLHSKGAILAMAVMVLAVSLFTLFIHKNFVYFICDMTIQL